MLSINIVPLSNFCFFRSANALLAVKKIPRQIRLRYQIALLFDGEADIGVFEPILGDSRCTKGDLLRVDARVKDSHPQKMARFGLGEMSPECSYSQACPSICPPTLFLDEPMNIRYEDSPTSIAQYVPESRIP